MYAAYEALSSAVQRMLDGLHATHDLTGPLTRAIADGNAHVDLRAMQDAWPPVVHPVVRTNPVDGRRALFVNGNFTTGIVELGRRENQALLPFLIDWVRSPEFQVRLRWEPDTIAFWDNRWVQHFAVPDYRERRVMHRVTLAGDRPV
jgi:taurine dioxygenase